MPITSDSVFTYTFLLCVALIVCAFTLFGVIRRNAPELGWHRHGKVNTEFLNIIDILGISIFFGIYAFFLKEYLDPPRLDENGDPVIVKITPAILFVGMIVQLVPAMVVLVLLIFRKIDPIRFFGVLSKSARYLIVIAPAGVIVTYLFLYGLEATGYNAWLSDHFGDQAKLQQTVKTYQEANAVTVRVMIAISVVLIAPIAEEIVFRGYIYTVTKRFSDRFFAAALSSLLFGVVHFNIMALLPLVFLALILTLAYELTGSLWAPISIHAMFNGTTILFQEIQFH
jgi:membrane protease YdiL (CAAX protease family)